MPKIVHIVYMSMSTCDFSEKDLEDLLFEIRSKNEKMGVTGLLLYNDGVFIQAIEGEVAIIQKLFQIITEDKRHSNVVKLLEEEIGSRDFPDWSMGFKRIENYQIGKVPGFSELIECTSQLRTSCRSEESGSYPVQ